jgi:hypothetical protein
MVLVLEIEMISNKTIGIGMLEISITEVMEIIRREGWSSLEVVKIGEVIIPTVKVGENFWVEIVGMVMIIPHKIMLVIFSSMGWND